MKSIYIFLFLCVLAIPISCKKNTYKKYIINRYIDVSKPHNIKAKYYVNQMKDTTFKDSCYIKVNVLSRIDGNKVKNGTIFIYGSEKKYIDFDTSTFLIKVKAGGYTFNVKSDLGSLMDSTTDELIIRENSYVEIYFYMGSLVQF